MTGTRLGPWHLLEEVGRGPLGIVYKAAADDGSGEAAVKVLTHDAARDPGFQQRFPAEMLALQRLNHPNIAKFYDSGVVAGTCYYATEWCPGADAATILKLRTKSSDEPGLPWRTDVLPAAVQLARALKHGHHRSILHRGLKPSNVMLMPDGSLKVTDFGVAKAFNLAPLSLPADTWGTAGFVAPEHFTGKPFTRRSDLYALGGLLYCLVAGRPPYPAGTLAELMHKHCYVLPDRPAQFVPKLPLELDDLICELLAKDPGRRPGSAAAVLSELDAVRGKVERKGESVPWPEDPGDTALHAALAESSPQSDDDSPRERPLLSRAAVVVPLFLLVLATILYFVFRPGPTPADLFAAGSDLMQSDNPADWDRAWDDYFAPLARKFPDQYANEVKAYREKITGQREMRKAVDAGRKLEIHSEAERLYRRGLGQVSAGDPAGAERTWAAVTAVFGPIEAEERWVRLAKAGIAELTKAASTGPHTDRRAAVLLAVDYAKSLRDGGKTAEADKVFDALAELYREDPAALDLVRKARDP
jgi:serine/threonine protein kinase